MNDFTRDRDPIDRIADDIRNQRLDDSTVAAATDRVWDRLRSNHDAGAALRSCDDVRALLPALVAGELGEARALLVTDHTRECLGCRRTLLELRGAGPATTPTAPAADSGRRLPRWLQAAAAAVLVIGGGAIAAHVISNLAAERAFTARVVSSQGRLFAVAGSSTTVLTAGDTVGARQRLRTGRNAGAFVELDDGSMVEISPRSELSFRASRRGATIALDRGNVIVHAADQGPGRLAVDTGDCRVAVKGTIFAVNHGLKGSRVSVIEGEVEVRYGGTRSSLEPGDQVTTDERLATVAITDDIAWSAHADDYTELLRELTALQRDLVGAVDTGAPRTSTRLLDLAPPDTVLYLAMPNLADGLGAARQIFSSRLADSEVLRDWWQREIVANGIDAEIEASLDRLQFLGEALGDEVAVALPGAVLHGAAAPLVLADLEDPRALRALLDDHLGSAEAPPVAVIDSPSQTVADDAEVVIWVTDDLVAATAGIDALRDLAARRAGAPSAGFAATELHARLAERYAAGVDWLVGFDVARALSSAAASGSADEAEILDRIGLLDATTLIIERHRTAAGSAIDAELRFAGPRRGMAAWLAEPAPLSTLDFISADAPLVTSVAAKDGLELFDELIGAVAETGPDALVELDRFEDELGIDLRDDLAAAVGGEGSFALDGPVLPLPTWKLVLEVYDPATLDHAFRRVLDRADAELAAHGSEPLAIRRDTRRGMDTTTVSHPSSPVAVTWTMADGYLIAGPSRAAVEHAIRVRDTGLGIADSAGFRDLLPANGFTNCSALVYRNLSGLMAALPDGAVTGELARYGNLLRDGAAPGLVCVYGLDDRILVSGTGPSLFALAPVLGMPGLVPGAGALGGIGTDPVSSPS